MTVMIITQKVSSFRLLLENIVTWHWFKSMLHY